jgi:hypothetical protein
MPMRKSVVTEKKQGNRVINLGVEEAVHRQFDALAFQRGMKLRHVPGYLVELLAVCTPEQEQKAYQRWVEKRRQQYPVGVA